MLKQRNNLWRKIVTNLLNPLRVGGYLKQIKYIFMSVLINMLPANSCFYKKILLRDAEMDPKVPHVPLILLNGGGTLVKLLNRCLIYFSDRLDIFYFTFPTKNSCLEIPSDGQFSKICHKLLENINIIETQSIHFSIDYENLHSRCSKIVY